ncbi:hypothetical protein BD626DRAFT_584138 [Schizophyllum amplum]|uniref:Uncharacterized protein n=1 Tax=Schizophyllum amplum TaxID=97359 RepID=A0A550CC21_9AGAR|nr:hypothetical protein BD626DRAFT_584138 [Auriculariopsis ampla]
MLSDVQRSSMIIGNLTYLQHPSDACVSAASAFCQGYSQSGKRHSRKILPVGDFEDFATSLHESRRFSLALDGISSAENTPALSCSEFSDVSSPATTCSEFTGAPDAMWSAPTSSPIKKLRKPRPTTICVPPSFRPQLSRRSIGYKTAQTLEFNRRSSAAPTERYDRVLEIATQRPLALPVARARSSKGLRPLSLVAKADVSATAPSVTETSSTTARARRLLLQAVKARLQRSDAPKQLWRRLGSIRQKVIVSVPWLGARNSQVHDVEAALPNRNAVDSERPDTGRGLRPLRLTRRTTVPPRAPLPEAGVHTGLRQTMFRWMMEWLWDAESESVMKASADAATFLAMSIML